jgi:2-methylcitrate dehydratase
MITQAMGRRAALKGAGAALAFALAGMRGPAALAAAKGPTVAQDIARWLAALRYEDVPANVVARAKRIVLDTIGCAMGGLNAEPVRMARSVVALQGGNPQASLIGVGGKVACDQAAFLNGMALRYLDYNDYIALGRPHHASINVAPALAVAEMQGASGQEFLLGFIAGYELEVRLRDAIAAKELEGWDGTSIVAQYASAATAGKLLNLNAKRLANALAIAGSNANTLGEVRRGAEMTPAKGSAEPMAARNGVFAALLAREGLEYPLTMLDGQYGYAKMVPGVLDEAVLRRRDGEFQILKSCIKLWPCVGTAQAPIAEALEIYKQHPRADEIERITVSLSDFAYKQQIAYPEVINTREHADHSVPYLVARALLDGAVGVNDFDEARFKDGKAIAVMKRMALRSEPSLSNTDIGANIEAVARGGAVLIAKVPIPPGAMQNPPDDAALSRKFLALCEPVLGRARAEAAVETILSVDSMPDLGKLMAAVTRDKPG